MTAAPIFLTDSITCFQPADTAPVIELWQTCGLVVPWNDPHLDIARKLARGADLFLVGRRDNELVATVMGGYDGHRGWVNYLAVSEACRGQRWGRKMMEAVEVRLIALGCPKLNLQVRGSNADVIAFYEALGYTLDDVVSLGKRLQG